MTSQQLPYGHPRIFDSRKAAGRNYESPTAQETRRCEARRSVERIQDARALAKELGCSLSEVLEDMQ
ncbi:hypothetical protein [Vibrio sp. TBV020]|uniref:hypothetical protein n=1 Tax=Vibrio sp. TBV020 TaxID=3137398 RepID=UPI0038CD6FD4